MYGTGLEEKCTILKAMVISQQAPPASKSLSADVLKEGSHVLSDVLTSKLSFIAFNSWYNVATFRQDPESTFGAARRCMFSTEIYRTVRTPTELGFGAVYFLRPACEKSRC